MNRNQKLILIIGVIFVVMIAIGLGGAYMQSQQGKVIITTVPNDSTVTLDGKTINNNGPVYIQPGKYTIKASRNLFRDQSKDFTIKAGETQSVQFYLLSDGDAATQWLSDHPDQASAIEGYYGAQIENKGTALYNNNTILSQLPVIDATYRIDYGNSQKGGQFALYIQAADQSGRADALDWMRTYGFDPTKYEIIWVDPITQAQTPATPADLAQ